jgi:hypothetical protein
MGKFTTLILLNKIGLNGAGEGNGLRPLTLLYTLFREGWFYYTFTETCIQHTRPETSPIIPEM